MARNQFMLERAQKLRATSTPAERRIWSILRAKRLAGLKFRRQHVVGNFIVDFVCLPARLIIEVDGDTHGDDEAALRDAKRTDEIEGFGYRVIRFWDHYVLNDPEGGIHEAILEALMASALPVTEKARLRTFLLDPLPDPLPCGARGTESLDPLPDPLPCGARGDGIP
jgi:very-short-patch-repair endonuclease